MPRHTGYHDKREAGIIDDDQEEKQNGARFHDMALIYPAETAGTGTGCGTADKRHGNNFRVNVTMTPGKRSGRRSCPRGFIAGRLISADLRVEQAVARFGADRRADMPAAQQAFTQEAGLFHNAGRGEVFGIAKGPHAEKRRLRQPPRSDVAYRFGHQPAAPVRATEHIADHGPVEVKAHADGANGLVGAAQAELPSVMTATFSHLPCAHDAVQEFSQRFDFGVVAPREITSDFGIAGISGERRLGVLHAG